MADRFIAKLEEHLRRFPAFKVERVASMFLDAPPKVRAAYCYQPISSFTKAIHRANRFASLAASQD